MKTGRISVIIINYNVRNYLFNCIISVQKSDVDRDVEIIVVDNNSLDESVAMLKSQFSSVKIIENDDNVGFARGVNEGVRVASGDYIMVLNPDTILSENTLQVLSDYLDEHPDVGIIGPKILNADGTLQLSCKRSFPTPGVALPKLLGLSRLFSRNKWAGRYNLTFLDENETHEVEAISGSCMFIRHDVFHGIGLFDERFFLFGEDLDFCYRTIEKRWKIRYVPTTQIIHYKGESVRLAPFDSLRYFYDAMNLFVEKHFSRTASLVTRWGLKTGILLKKASAYLSASLSQSISAFLDVFSVVGAFTLAIFIRFGSFDPLFTSYIPVLLIYSLFWLLVGSLFQLYTRFILSYNRAFLSSAMAFLCIVAFTYFFKQFAFSRAVILVATMIIVFVIPGWRLLAHVLMSRGFLKNLHIGEFPLFSRRAIVIGAGTEGQRITRNIKRRLDTGIYVVGFADKTFQTHEGSAKRASPPFLGVISNIRDIVQLHLIRELIFTSDRLTNREILSIMDSTKDMRLTYRIVPRKRDILLGRAVAEDVSEFPFVNIEYTLYHRLNLFSKRLFDMFLSATLILFMSPVLLVLLLRFPRWEKVELWGVDGTKFHARLVRAKSRFLRELPLLVPILVGKMSFVGSSLLPVSEGSTQLMCKPGLTGLDRIKKVNTDSDDKFVYEHYYMQNQSLALDLEILLRSVFAV